MLLWQGNAHGPTFPVRLAPFTAETWLVDVAPVIRTLGGKGMSTRVTPFVTYAGKDVLAAQWVDLVNIAGMNK
jgi:hypothetical protein